MISATLDMLPVETIRVIADPLRARILELLARESLCTCHLVAETGAGQTNVSNHLRAMRQAGLVTAEPYGRYTYYRVRPGPLRALAAKLSGLADAADAASKVRRPCP